VGRKPGPLVGGVREIVPKIIAAVQAGTGQKFAIKSEKPATRKGRKAIVVALTSEYDRKTDLTLTFFENDHGGLSVAAESQGRHSFYGNASEAPDDLAADGTIENVISGGRLDDDAMVWTGVSVADITSIGLSYDDVLASMRSDAQAASVDAFDEAWRNEREVAELLNRHLSVLPFDEAEFWTLWLQKDKRAEDLVRKWTKVENAGTPDRMPLKRAVSRRADIDDVLENLRAGLVYRD
jgi:hypothetical protein